MRSMKLRRQVYELHVQGRPDIFKPGFGQELQAEDFRKLESLDGM